MISINKIKQLRRNPYNSNVDLTPVKSLNSDLISFYIILFQFENTFRRYRMSDITSFSGYSKKDILKYIKLLHKKNIINKDKLNINLGVEVK